MITREILLHHEAIAIAAKNNVAGLYEYTKHEYDLISFRKAPEQMQLPSVAFAFFFNPACGEGGIIQATFGASEEEDGLEGILYRFHPAMAENAQREMLAELTQLQAEQPVVKLVDDAAPAMPPLHRKNWEELRILSTDPLG